MILVFLSVLITTVLSFVIGYINKNVDVLETVSTMMGCTFAIILLQSIIYPVIFKYGIEKGRIALFVGVFLITGIIGILMNNVQISIPESVVNFFNNYGIIVLTLAIISIFLISYKISERIYLKKEF